MRRIAYVIEGMYNSGGMERVLSVCANALCKDVDITIITLQQKGREYFFPLDGNIHTCDLGIINIADKHELKQCLSHFFTENCFDVVVSLGGIDMYFLHSIRDGSRKIIWFHFSFNISIGAWLGESPSLIKKCRGYLQLAKRIYHAKKYDKIVAISRFDYKSWQKFTSNVALIYNPITISNPHKSYKISKQAISVGRLDYQKGFDYLIDAWKIVYQKHPDWHLNIFGDGTLKGILQKQIDMLSLNEVVTLCGSTPDITNQYFNHSIFILSSRTEAFGLVLVEAASCGLPLISFDSPSGPREILENGINGYLIKKVGDVETMANMICRLIENEDLRMKMGENAKKKVENEFTICIVKKQWVDLFDELF